MKKTYEVPALDILNVIIEDCLTGSDDLGVAPEDWVG